MIRHIKELGITTIQLDFVAEAMSEPRLVNLGLVNYWGYNPVLFRWHRIRAYAVVAMPWLSSRPYASCIRPGWKWCWTWSTTIPPSLGWCPAAEFQGLRCQPQLLRL